MKETVQWSYQVLNALYKPVLGQLYWTTHLIGVLQLSIRANLSFVVRSQYFTDAISATYYSSKLINATYYSRKTNFVC